MPLDIYPAVADHKGEGAIGTGAAVPLQGSNSFGFAAASDSFSCSLTDFLYMPYPTRTIVRLLYYDPLEIQCAHLAS